MNVANLAFHLACRSGDAATIAWARLAHRAGMFKLYQPVPDLSLAMNTLRPRIQKRLRAIQGSLPEESLIGLDIGSNIGFYTFELAKKGHHVMSVEGGRAEFAILSAARRRLRQELVVPVQWTLTPDNINLLPEVDFTIFMSVFHHWCRDFGQDDALKMLGVIISRSRRVLFFETAQYDETSETYKNILPDRGAGDSEQWWHQYFKSRGCVDVRTIHKQGRALMAVYPRYLGP